MHKEMGPSDSQLDRIDDEYHLIIRKKSKRSSNERKKTVELWNKYRVRLGYSETYTQELEND